MADGVMMGDAEVSVWESKSFIFIFLDHETLQQSKSHNRVKLLANLLLILIWGAQGAGVSLPVGGTEQNVPGLCRGGSWKSPESHEFRDVSPWNNVA